MDMFKFLSFILLGMCLLFGGCKKENPVSFQNWRID